jgi:hypothetical protein
VTVNRDSSLFTSENAASSVAGRFRFFERQKVKAHPDALKVTGALTFWWMRPDRTD